MGEAVGDEEVRHGEEGGWGVTEEARRRGEEDAEEGKERKRLEGERVAAKEGEEVSGGEGREEAEQGRGRGGRERRWVEGEAERNLGRRDDERIRLARGRGRGRKRRPRCGVPWWRNGRRRVSGRRAALDGARAEGSASVHWSSVINGDAKRQVYLKDDWCKRNSLFCLSV